MTVDDILEDIISSKPGATQAEQVWCALTDISGGHNVNAAILAVDLFSLALRNGFVQWEGLNVRWGDSGEGGFTLLVDDKEVEVVAVDAENKAGSKGDE